MTSDGFVLALAGREIIRHSAAEPWLFVGRGHERIEMYRGNFAIEDRPRRAGAAAAWSRPAVTATAGGSSFAATPATPRRYRWSAEVAPTAPSCTSGRPTRASIASGCGSWPRLTSTSGGAASRCPISICAAATFLYGPRSPGSVATRRPTSPGRPMSPAGPAATITTPTTRSRPFCRRAATWRTSKPRPMPTSTSAIRPSTSSSSGLCPRHSS